jgi:hypothetical protein
MTRKFSKTAITCEGRAFGRNPFRFFTLSNDVGTSGASTTVPSYDIETLYEFI